MDNLTYDDAFHLLSRMGFGGNSAEVNSLVGRSAASAVDSLLDYQQVNNDEMERILAESFDFSDPFDFTRFHRGELQRWWLTRMVFTRRPFEEKMTLFWHNHFATSINKVPEVFMFIQNRTLRENCLVRFDTLLLKLAQDPAMLIWLDGISNVKGAPNENFGRELQELFSMGITDVVTGQPNYSEQDVKEIARAFTGWKFFGPRGPQADPFDYRFFVNPPEHDNNVKTIYGQTANFGGEDVLSLIAARRATPRFLVTQLFEFFVYPLTSSAADKATIEQFTDIYTNRNHSIRELMSAIFTSDQFFSARARSALVKSPVQLVVGAIRMLGAQVIPGTYRNNPNHLALFTTLLGQELFNPPDVAGWNQQLGWINTALLLNRYTFADFLAVNRPPPNPLPSFYLSHDLVKSMAKKTPKKTVKKLLSTLGSLKVDAETRRMLEDYLQKDAQGNLVGYKRDDLTADKKIRGLIHLILSLSEFQLH